MHKKEETQATTLKNSSIKTNREMWESQFKSSKANEISDLNLQKFKLRNWL